MNDPIPLKDTPSDSEFLTAYTTASRESASVQNSRCNAPHPKAIR